MVSTYSLCTPVVCHTHFHFYTVSCLCRGGGGYSIIVTSGFPSGFFFFWGGGGGGGGGEETTSKHQQCFGSTFWKIL